MVSTEAQATLANVLADALARHEAGECDSVVMVECDTAEYLAWLDFERAGRIAARALVEVPAPAGWTGPSPLFAVCADVPVSSSLPHVDTTVAPAGSPQPSAGAGSHSGPGAFSPPAPPGPVATTSILDGVLALAREVIPHESQRHRWFVEAMVEHLGRDADTTTYDDVGELSTVDLLRLLDRLARWRAARDRNVRRRGMYGRSPGSNV